MTRIPFHYTAIDRSGASRRGTATASSRVEAYRALVAEGLTPVDIMAAGRGLSRGGRGGVKAKEIANFSYQLAVLIGARIPLGDGLRSIAEQDESSRLREVLGSIANRIDAGENIAIAMEAHREVFGDVFLETVRAAEKTGNLGRVLEYLADMLERAQEIRQQVRSALTYPVCVLAILGLAVVFLVGFVVPKFGRMYVARGLQLPLLTRVLLGLGESVQAYWWAYLAAGAGLGFGLWRLWRSEGGRYLLDRVLHRLPFLRDLLVGAAVSRFVRVFGLCLSSGLNLIEAIELSARASGRPMLQRDAERLTAQVQAGGRLSVAFASCDYLPKFARRMLAAGEESAELPKMCGVVARQYDREVSALAKNLTTVIEPVMVVLIAAVVGIVALAVFLPMWNMVQILG